jgi:hypothetical protein
MKGGVCVLLLEELYLSLEDTRRNEKRAMKILSLGLIVNFMPPCFGLR